jgi:hypothetical protein
MEPICKHGYTAAIIPNPDGPFSIEVCAHKWHESLRVWLGVTR